MSEIERENPGSNVPFGVTLVQDASLVATPVLGKNDEVLELGEFQPWRFPGGAA